jgi:predicted protein tyrosine phosphatase
MSMPVIHICSLKMVESLAAAVKPSHILSVLGGVSPFPPTPHGIDPNNHLRLTVSDITEPQDGMIHPAADHVDEIIAFGRRWSQKNGGGRPILVHCFAGISRSTASALAIACAVRPDVPEAAFTSALRKASASAQPNALMVDHADALLKRERRIVAAVEDMGLGDFSQAGQPFVLTLDL